MYELKITQVSILLKEILCEAYYFTSLPISAFSDVILQHEICHWGSISTKATSKFYKPELFSPIGPIVKHLLAYQSLPKKFFFYLQDDHKNQTSLAMVDRSAKRGAGSSVTYLALMEQSGQQATACWGQRLSSECRWGVGVWMRKLRCKHTATEK